ncbi:SDR family oxidoreductase [Halobacteriaceae archaeon GCM10025711]
MSTPEIDRVLVAGASGGTGREILLALDDLDVTVVGHTTSPEKRTSLTALGADEVVVADLLDRGDAGDVVEGCDAILSTVGTNAALGFLVGDLVDGTGTINLGRAAQEAGVDRFVMESAIGVGDSRNAMALPVRVVLRRPLAAKDRAERFLRRTDLGYTILRPGRLTNDPATGDVVVGERGGTVSGSVPRADVARLMVAALYTPEARNRTFEVVSRPGLGETLGSLADVEWADPWTEREE